MLVTGEFAVALDLGCGQVVSAGQDDVFVAKLDPAGACLWTKRAGDASNQTGTGVAFDQAGNGYVVGRFQGSVDFGCGPLTTGGGHNMFVAKLDTSGDCVWSKRAGDGYSQRAADVTVDAAQNVVVTGEFDGSMDLGCNAPITTSSGALFVAKLDASGTCVWLNGTTFAAGFAVSTDAANNVLIAGQYDWTSKDFGCGPLGSVSGEAFVAKLDATGKCIWSTPSSGSSTEWATDVEPDQLGNAYVVGYANGMMDLGCGSIGSNTSSDGYVAKLDSQGKCVWSKQIGGAGTQRALGLDVDPSGNVIVAGETWGTLDLGCGAMAGTEPRAFVAKLDPDGACIWTKKGGALGHHSAVRVAAGHDGTLVVAGKFSSTIDFGCAGLVGQHTNAFVAKLSP